MINIDEVSYKRAKFRQAGLEVASGIASEGDTARQATRQTLGC